MTVSDNEIHHIQVNGTPKQVPTAIVSYADAVRLGLDPVPVGENVLITVDYHDSDNPDSRDGSLAPGESIRVKKQGTSFDVFATTRS